MPNRYEPAPGPYGRLDLALRRARSLAAKAAPTIVENALFPRFGRGFGGYARAFARTAIRPKLDLIGERFDSPFYIEQISDPDERVRAERDPLLHYAAIGWMRERSPAARFDPEHYRRSIANLPSAADPYVDFLRRGASTPANEAEAAGAPPVADDGSSNAVLTVHHARGGGSSEYLSRYEALLRASGRRVFRLRAVPGAPHLGVLDESLPGAGIRSTAYDLRSGLASLALAAKARGVSLVVANHLIDRPPEAFDWIVDLCGELRCGYEAILHDYFAVCPRVDLVTGFGRNCGIAEVDECRRCVSAHGSQVDSLTPAEWRRRFAAFLAGAVRIVAPSRDLAARLSPHVGGLSIDVWEADDDARLPSEIRPAIAEGEAFRLATLGSLNVPKGARVVLGLARALVAAKEPVAITAIGPSSDAPALRRAGVRVTGRYAPSALDALIAEANPHAVLLPAIWPETWSFVLSEALRRGLPVIAFDLGAPAERLRRLARGTLLPPELAHQPAALAEALLALRRAWTA